MFLFSPYFVSPSPQTNTILYSCYLCKQCTLFLFLHSVNPAVSNWDAADRAQSIPDSATIFFGATHGSAWLRRFSLVYFDTGSSQVAQRRLKKAGSQMPEWLREKGSIFKVKHQLSRLWMVLNCCALVPLNCVDDEENIVMKKKHNMSVVKPNIGIYQPFYYRYECIALYIFFDRRGIFTAEERVKAGRELLEIMGKRLRENAIYNWNN